MDDERFGPYELVSLLGRGGMGEVHRARDTRKDRGEVALKRLPAGLGADEDFQRRFLREAEMTARLRDPHVVPIHDYGQIDDRPYLDMRLVDGPGLGDELARHGPLAPDRAVGIVTQVAGALDAAHREGLVHRDIKPANVLLWRPEGAEEPTGQDFVYLIDFGLAANLLTSRRSSTLVSGTAAYMAPERFTAGGDHRVDVYALGCLFHEMLTGAPPYSGDFVQLMFAHTQLPPPAPSASRPELAGFDQVVATALAKNPDHRHPSAGALATAAQAALGIPGRRSAPATAVLSGAARPTTPVPPPTSSGGGSPASPRWVLAAVAALVVVAVVGVIVAVARSSSTSASSASAEPPAPPAATIPVHVTNMAPFLDSVESLALAPDGRRAYAYRVDTSEKTSLAVLEPGNPGLLATIPLGDGRAPNGPTLFEGLRLSADGRQAFVLNWGSTPGGDGLVAGLLSVVDTASGTLMATFPVGEDSQGFAVSPDGRSVYVVGLRGVSVVDIAARTVTATIPIDDDSRSVVVAPDGRHVYVVGQREFTIDTATNTVVGSAAMSGGFPSIISMSPDGRHAYISAQGDKAVLVMDTASSTITARIPLAFDVSSMAVSPDGSRLYAASSQSIADIDTATNSVSGVIRQLGVWGSGELAHVDFGVAAGNRRLYSPTGGAVSEIDES
jgi:serine/threonine protein kinase, bacterial